VRSRKARDRGSTPIFFTCVFFCRYSSRVTTSKRGGGIVVNAHFTWSGCCGRIEHSTIGFRRAHLRRGGEVAGRDAAAREHVHVVGRNHFPIDRDGLLRLGAIVLHHKLDLPAGNAALGVECRDRDLDTVAPRAIDRRGISR